MLTPVIRRRGGVSVGEQSALSSRDHNETYHWPERERKEVSTDSLSKVGWLPTYRALGVLGLWGYSEVIARSRPGHRFHVHVYNSFFHQKQSVLHLTRQ